MSTIWPQKKWIFPQEEAHLPFIENYDLPPVAAQVLYNRGITDEAAFRSFTAPRISQLPDPDLLPDMPEASRRLARAIIRQEDIVIFGDYDADGVTSTALLYSFIDYCGCPVSWYIPHRTDEGYGLNSEAVRKIAEGGANLIVTVDCGSNSVAEVTLAKQLGMEVIVTDHHPIPGPMAPALAVVNPQRPDHSFPDTNLAGVGVAFHLVASTRRLLRKQGFWGNARHPEMDLRELLDLVAIGSIADVVSLTKVNRILVTAGLAQIMESTRPGLQELCDISGVNLPLTAADISFKLAPRINAHGRMWRADEGVKLLLTKDQRMAKALAVQLDTANNQRKATEKEVTEDCERQLAAHPEWLDNGILVLADDRWHPGVVGIVAGRLSSQYGKPTLVIGRDGKGSGRSLENIDLAALLEGAADLLEHFGGHPAAAGVKMDLSNVDQLRDRLNNLLSARHIEISQATLAVDACISLDDLDDNLLKFLTQLEPTGMGNQTPVFVTKNVNIKAIRPVGQEHLKLILDHDVIKEAMAYKMANSRTPLGACVADLAYTIGYSTYRGHRELHLKIEDIAWKTGI